MDPKAYILIEAERGRIDDALMAIREMPGVIEADSITGPFDLIAVADVEDLNILGALVKQHIQSAPGVVRTVTCISIS